MGPPLARSSADEDCLSITELSTHLCIWIVFSNIDGPVCCPKSALEDPLRPDNGRKYQSVVENRAKHSVHVPQSRYFFLIRRVKRRVPAVEWCICNEQHTSSIGA